MSLPTTVPLMLSLSILLIVVSAAPADEEKPKLVEHEISEKQALYTAQELYRHVEPPRSGCKLCSPKDIEYCKSEHLLKDHCCCDRNQPERYPFIPHVCYINDVPLCRPKASDCETHIRLDICCCQPYLRPQWSFYAWSMPASSSTIKVSINILILILFNLATG